MKVILYVGAVLMTGASIYGFIDYQKTSHDKAFTNLYSIKEPAAVIETKQSAAETKTVAATPEPAKTEAAPAKPVKAKSGLVKKKRKKISSEMFSRKAMVEFVPPKVMKDKKE